MELLRPTENGVAIWWASASATKIQPRTAPPREMGTGIKLASARNEREGAQLVLTCAKPVSGVRIVCDPLTARNGDVLEGAIEFFHVRFLKVAISSDKQSKAGFWPDPLCPIEGPLDLGANSNHIFWIRTAAPKSAAAGKYSTTLRLSGEGFFALVPLELEVFDFTLPDRMSCATAFGFSPAEVFRYHRATTDEHKRILVEKYLANLASHHISPYNPAPLDPMEITWPSVHPPRTPWDDWRGLKIVTNEVHAGQGALLVYDDQPGLNVTVQYSPLIPLPTGGVRLCGWYRTALPGHRFHVSLNNLDASKQWISGANHDVGMVGNGYWQPFDETVTNFPSGAAYVQLHLRATPWTDRGEQMGLVWFDDLSLTGIENDKELLAGGDFERKPRTSLVAPIEELQVKIDFTNWDRAMDRAINIHQFTSFQVDYPGLGGGTFHEIDAPNLLGFREEDPEYPVLLASYGRQLEIHLRDRGWLDRAFVYWFDEPSPEQYPFVMNGFAKLKQYSPGITRMLTEQVEPGLVGGPNLWCPISNEYNHHIAIERRSHGERFWWYVCTGPKAPYAGLFIDHSAPEMRLWAWQTWQRGIQGLLVWQINYWTSSSAYPEHNQPQNPYQDTMSWMSGYSTPRGERHPWGNGDGRFIYPPLATATPGDAPVLDGPVDSIRWEHLRDGIEDYEYFSILRHKLERQKAELSPEEFKRMEGLLEVPREVTGSMTEFAGDGAPMDAHRLSLARAIEKLGRR